MNKIIKVFTTGFLLILVTSSCEFNNEEELYGIKIVEPTEVSYSTDISPIIQMSCISCHTQGGFANGFFDDYDGVKTKVDNGSFRQRVLVQKDMPPEGSLSDKELELIKAWLDDGAPNN
ncbi:MULTISPECIES: c-type cytochrome [unclassified Saccharicrinis]|uniref:c-type cytochrome n=1 Tax=unclassified Saccharicrinis TaxID=2646859 RepID=UPI003D33B9F6